MDPEEKELVSTSASQTFVVPASIFLLLGGLPAGGLVKKMDMQPGAPAERVKLDVKRSEPGRPPGAAPPWTTAADAPAGLGLSGTFAVTAHLGGSVTEGQPRTVYPAGRGS